MNTNFDRIASVTFVALVAFCNVSLACETLRLIPSADEADQFFLIQANDDDRVILGPNECFFPKLGLTAEGSAPVPTDVALRNLNGGKSFAEIRGWDEGDVAEWGVWFPKAGEVELRLKAVGLSGFTLQIGQQKKNIAPDRPVRFQISAPGQRIIQLLCSRADRGTAVRQIILSGGAAMNASVIRKRWRPSAAHTKFSSSEAGNDIRLWIVEMDAFPGELGFYSPITTPFGYYGPTWNADGTVNAGFNFSLWSFGRNQPEPPLNHWSHLIAIGNRNASFGGFDHEGTGVKIRDWEPLAGRQGQRQAIALRVDPGEMYDTYHSYFYATDEQRWRLFGSGKKYNRGKPIESL